LPDSTTLVVVSGPPRSGKTTLAHALAKAIPCPAICRDEIKEGLVHALGGAFEPAPSDRLTERTLPLFFDVLRMLLAAEVTVVAEAAFQDHVWRPRLEALAALARLRIVQCHVEPAVAHARRRAESGVHARLSDAIEDWEHAYTAFDRLSLAAPSIDVDTADGYTPGIDEIIEFVSSGEPGA